MAVFAGVGGALALMLVAVGVVRVAEPASEWGMVFAGLILAVAVLLGSLVVMTMEQGAHSDR